MAMPRFAGLAVRDVVAADLDVSAGRVLKPGDEAQQRRLAAARGADEDHELAVVDRKIDAVDDVDIAERLLHLLELQT